jgi:hypothetical protein
MGPDVPFSCTDGGREWPGTAQHLSVLAPQLAPRDLVSLANVRILCPPRIRALVSLLAARMSWQPLRT